MQAKFGIIEIPRSIETACENARLTEEHGFDMVGVADSQSLFRELFVTLSVIGGATERVVMGPTVTNPLTRHPAVMASGLASIQEIAGGRAFLGIATGDSAIYNLGARPRGLAGLKEYIQALRRLFAGEHTEFGGKPIHTRWIGGLDQPQVPIYIAAEGPKTLEEIDIWALGCVNVGEDRAALICEIRMVLASPVHHAFRFTQEGKLVPPQFADAIREVQQGYKSSHHEDLGESPNAQLMQDPELLAYMVDRFAVLGTPEEFVA